MRPMAWSFAISCQKLMSCKLVQFQVDRARTMMLAGAPLGSILTGRIGLEMRMIIAGGLRILSKLESAQYDMFRHRPMLRPFDWVIMLAKSAPFSNLTPPG